MVKKPVATINSQCRLRNSFHVVLRLRSGAGSMPAVQDLRDRVTREVMPPIGRGTLDSPIAPIPVFFCHAHNQSFDLSGGARSPRCTMAVPSYFWAISF